MDQEPSGKDEEGVVYSQLLAQREERGDTYLKGRHKHGKDRSTEAFGNRSGNELAWGWFGIFVMIHLIPKSWGKLVGLGSYG